MSYLAQGLLVKDIALFYRDHDDQKVGTSKGLAKLVMTLYIGMCLWKEIIKTTDGGASWIAPLMSYDGPGQVRCMVEDAKRSGHLFAAAGYTTLETKDGGESWVDLESPNASGIASLLYDSEEKALYVGTGSWPTPSGVFVYK